MEGRKGVESKGPSKESKLSPILADRNKPRDSAGSCLHNTLEVKRIQRAGQVQGRTQHKKGGSFKMEEIHLGIKKNARLGRNV